MVGSIPLISRVAALYELVNASLEPTLAHHGITSSTFQLLSAVQAAGDGQTQRQIADRLGIAPASLSEALTSAEKAGLVERKPSASDKRARVLSLTKRGRQVLEAAVEALGEIERQAAQDLSRLEQDDLERTLQRMIANLAG
ncbi:MAG: MarR family transcriptional regulator [Fimbriimonadaceae bacterium]|nr:MarR family transcriptional regulator [Fimbriimonadaceae bacterium]